MFETNGDERSKERLLLSWELTQDPDLLFEEDQSVDEDGLERAKKELLLLEKENAYHMDLAKQGYIRDVDKLRKEIVMSIDLDFFPPRTFVPLTISDMQKFCNFLAYDTADERHGGQKDGSMEEEFLRFYFPDQAAYGWEWIHKVMDQEEEILRRKLNSNLAYLKMKQLSRIIRRRHAIQFLSCGWFPLDWSGELFEGSIESGRFVCNLRLFSRLSLPANRPEIQSQLVYRSQYPLKDLTKLVSSPYRYVFIALEADANKDALNNLLSKVITPLHNGKKAAMFSLNGGAVESKDTMYFIPLTRIKVTNLGELPLDWRTTVKPLIEDGKRGFLVLMTYKVRANDFQAVNVREEWQIDLKAPALDLLSVPAESNVPFGNSGDDASSNAEMGATKKDVQPLSENNISLDYGASVNSLKEEMLGVESSVANAQPGTNSTIDNAQGGESRSTPVDDDEKERKKRRTTDGSSEGV